MAKKSTFWQDFKAFITRGNVVDMAVGVVIGGAFSKIVTGLVNFIINPCVAFITGDTDLSALKYEVVAPIIEKVTGDDGAITETIVKEGIYILYGSWIQTIIDFLIVAFCIFFVLRIITKLRSALEYKKTQEAEAKAAAEAEKAAADKKAAAEAAAALAAKQEKLDESILKQEALLTEIRDLMKNN